MTRSRLLLALSWVLLVPSCSSDTIDVGEVHPDGATPAASGGDPGGTAGGGAGGGGVGGTAGVGGTSGALPACTGTTSYASYANDYNVATTLSFASVTVAAASDFTVDWSQATVSLRGQAMVPATDVAAVWVWVFRLNQKSLAIKLNNESLGMRDVATVPLAYYPGGGKTSARLSEFTLNGSPIDLANYLLNFDPVAFPPDNYSYAIMLSSGTALGSDTQLIQAFQADPTSTNTTIAVVPTSTSLACAADLRSLTPLVFPVGQPALLLDFSQMAKDALGLPFDASSISSAVIGHFAQGPAELEAAFPNLDRLATQLFRGPVSGTTVDLSTLASAAGIHFGGFDTTGTWLLGLECSSCVNPAPRFLTIVKGCGAP